MDGLERLELTVEPQRVTALSTVICVDEGGYRIDHRWELDGDWRAQSVKVERWNSQGHGLVRLDREGSGWRVDGVVRRDLDGAEEPDLSVTPFCNTFPIRRTDSSRTLDTAFIDGPALTVARSRQRYERRGERHLRYIDLGLAKGFEADLEVDESGLVVRYEHLFERVAPVTLHAS